MPNQGSTQMLGSCSCPPDYCEVRDGPLAVDAEQMEACRIEAGARALTEQSREALEKKEGSRIDRDSLFVEMAELWSRRSTCLRGHTAAVIVRDRRPISVGYNGAPPGLPHCTEVGCEVDQRELEKYVERARAGQPPPSEEAIRAEALGATLERYGCQRTVHAELNAIAWAARAGIETKGATMYALSQPCLRCAQAIISAGITELVWKNEYRVQRLDLLEAAGVEVRRVDGRGD
jgi:dCMP deaminase